LRGHANLVTVLLIQVIIVNDVPFISIRDLLSSPLSTIGRLAAVGRRLDAANHALEEVLEDPLKGHLRVAHMVGDTLTLVADSPAWSARARYQSPRILEHLRQRLGNPGLARVQLLTRPVEARSKPAPGKPRRLSGRAASLLESVAASTDNEPLSHALRRLARRAPGKEHD
jgi:hypothetical protein